MAIGKLISKAAKEAAKKARAAQRKRAKANQNKPSSNSQSGQPEPGTVGARKTTKAKPTGVTKAKPTGVRKKAAPTGVTKAKPTGVTKAKSAVSKTLKKNPALSTIAKGSAIAGLIGGGAGLGNLILKGRGDKDVPNKPITFGSAFKEARKKGEGTKFTWNGKSYTAVTKDDLKKKGYDANELRQYANRKGKARGPLRRAGQGIKKVLLGKDKKFGGDKGAIDFIRRPKKKAGGGMANSSEPKKYQSGGMATKKYKAGGLATKGLGKAYMNSKR